MKNLTTSDTPPLTGLLDALRGLIRDGRHRALRAVDMVQVQTCWEIGRHIVEFEQGGEARAAYGKRLLPALAEGLTREFGKGFDASNLRYMRLFYKAFPIRDALRHELSWTHYRALLRVESETARNWYMQEAAGLERTGAGPANRHAVFRTASIKCRPAGRQGGSGRSDAGLQDEPGRAPD